MQNNIPTVYVSEIHFRRAKSPNHLTILQCTKKI